MSTTCILIIHWIIIFKFELKNLPLYNLELNGFCFSKNCCYLWAKCVIMNKNDYVWKIKTRIVWVRGLFSCSIAIVIMRSNDPLILKYYINILDTKDPNIITFQMYSQYWCPWSFYLKKNIITSSLDRTCWCFQSQWKIVWLGVRVIPIKITKTI